MLGYLYKLTNTMNNKVYIGKTYRTPSKRWSEHVRNSNKLDRPLYRAIRKYGQEVFELEVLGQFPSGDLEDQEIKYISHYNSVKDGYNATYGGEGRPYLNLDKDEVSKLYKDLGSVSAVARTLSVDYESVRKLLPNINKYGNDNIKKSVILVELGLEFDSLTRCAQCLQDSEIANGDVQGIRSHVRDVVNGKRKSAYGFTYKLMEGTAEVAN